METKETIRITTKHFKQVIPNNVALSAFEFLRDNVDWIQGIRSRTGPTRLAKPLDPTDLDDPVTCVVMNLIETAVTKAEILGNFRINGVYLNYYQDGKMWTPNHSHPKSCQIIISLGATRTLEIGKKKYPQKNGDLTIFGSSVHGVPKEPEILGGRISIATFMTNL